MDFSQQLPIVHSFLKYRLFTDITTFVITLISMSSGSCNLFFGSMSRIKPVSAFFKLLIWVVRGTPLMIQLDHLLFRTGIT